MYDGETPRGNNNCGTMKSSIHVFREVVIIRDRDRKRGRRANGTTHECTCTVAINSFRDDDDCHDENSKTDDYYTHQC